MGAHLRYVWKMVKGKEKIKRLGERRSGRKARASFIQHTHNSFEDVILLPDIKENWIFQSQALSQSSEIQQLEIHSC